MRQLRDAVAAERARRHGHADAENLAPVRAALRDGLQQASRAAAQLEVIREGLRARLVDAGTGEDEDLRARVIQAYERLGRNVEETLDCLREPTRPSETRVRVAFRMADDEGEEAEDLARENSHH